LEEKVDFKYRLVLNSDPPSSIPLMDALKELIQQLIGIVPHRTDIANDLIHAVEQDGLLEQMLSHRGVLTCSQLINGPLHALIKTLEQLQSEDKSTQTSVWWNAFQAQFQKDEKIHSIQNEFENCIYSLPSFLEFMNASIDVLKRDVANFYITQLSTILQGHRGEMYLSRCLMTRQSARWLADHSTSGSEPSDKDLFPNVYEWLRRTLFNEREHEEQFLIELNEHALTGRLYNRTEIGNNENTDIAVIAFAFVKLLQSPFRLDSMDISTQLPEPLSFDGKRMASIRDEIDMLSIISACIVTIRQIQVKYGFKISRYSSPRHSLNSIDWSDGLHHRLDALLRESTVTTDAIVAECVRYISISIDRNATVESNVKTTSSLMEWETEMTRALRQVIATTNPIFELYSKRIFRLLFAGLLNGNYRAKLQNYSLNSPSQERHMTDIIVNAKAIFNLLIQSHGHLCSNLMRTILNR
jgi:hypothetical protein